MLLKKSLSQKIKSAPQKPGVYLFKSSQGKVLYIGKALNLKNRLVYYLKPKDKKTRTFVKKAKKVDWVLVNSDLEAILLEMNLIKQLKPAYNSVWRDDKRPLYIVITNEPFPKVKTARLPQVKEEAFGPFPSPYKLRQVLKSLRKIFPFCTCRHPKRGCLYVHLGLCNPAPASITSRKERFQYLSNIRRLKLFLSGKTKKVVTQLQKEMRQASREQNFEKAAKLRDQISSIETLLTSKPQVATYLQSEVLDPNLPQAQVEAVEKLLKIPKLQRIEGYDVANLGGQLATASMVVFENGKPNTGQYRRFKVRLPEHPNDPAMMRHVLSRRLKHSEWPLPQVILIDGGKAQVGAAQKALKEKQRTVKLVGLAKREENLVIPSPNPDRKWARADLPPENSALTFFKAVRNEAHRFATNYHKLLRQKASLT